MTERNIGNEIIQGMESAIDYMRGEKGEFTKVMLYNNSIQDVTSNFPVLTEEQAIQVQKETLDRWREAEQDHIVSNEIVTEWLETWGKDE